MDAGERALLEETVRDAIGGVADAGCAAVDGVLTELGWLEMLDAEPRDAIDVVFTAIGATNAVATVLDDVVVAALGLEPRADLAVLLPPFARWDAPAKTDGARLEATGLMTARATTATEVVVVGEGIATTVPIGSVEVTPVLGADPTGGLHRAQIVVGDAAPTSVTEPGWESAVAAGRRAVSHQIAGATRTMLDFARTHATERVQFGRPVARFQAVRHRLAEALVAVEGLEATLGAAWDEPGPLTAALAKAYAGRAARTVSGHCQQVLAGIGFTTDHAFHRYLKRTMVLEGLFGSTEEIVVDLGRGLLETRTVPMLIEL